MYAMSTRGRSPARRRRGGHVRSRHREKRRLLSLPGVRRLLAAAGPHSNPSLRALREGAARSALVAHLTSGAAPFGVARLGEYWSRGSQVMQSKPFGVGVDHPHADFDYGTLEIRNVEQLSLPGPGLRLKELHSMVPPEVLEVFSDGSRLRRKGVIPKPPRACHLIDSSQEAPLYYRLFCLGMLRFVGSSFPVQDGRGRPVYNGLFQTPKSDGLFRLLMDMRPGNSCSDDPPDPELPGADSLPRALAYLEHRGVSTRTWGLWSEDSANCFHNIAAGLVAQRYQCLRPLSHRTQLALLSLGLPASALAEGSVPVIVSLAMGNKWAVYIAQQVAHNYVRRTMAALPPVVYAELVILPYIDDLNVAGCRLSPHASTFMTKYRQIMTGDGWELKDAKRVEGSPEAEALGITTNFDSGYSALALPKVAALHQELNEVLQGTSATPRRLREVLGGVVWCLLLHRPFLSFLFFSYRWMQREGRKAWDRGAYLPRSVRKELLSVRDILPFALFAFRAKAFGTVVSDACEYGGAGGYARWVPPMPTTLFFERTKIVAGCRPPMRFPYPAGVGFAFVRWPFRFTSTLRSIAHKELFSLLVAVAMEARAGALEHRPAHTIIFAYNDNMTTVSIVQKGRCRSLSLNRTLRRLSALCALQGTRLAIDYLYSELNPADGPSRDVGARGVFSYVTG